MPYARRLVVTCDDFGYHPTINEAIIEILARGVVRSVSIMPAAPHFEDAVGRLRAAGLHRAGVHLTLGSEYRRLPMTPLSPRALVGSLVDDSGRFPSDVAAHRGRLVPEDVAIELRAQIERVRQTGLHLTHLDGHMFCYEAEVGGAALLEVAEALAHAYRLPLRRRSPPADPAPGVHMLWKEIADVEDRCAYYADFLAEFRGPLAELIIHPGKDLASMREFSTTGERRLADYRFFSGDQFHELVRAHDIAVVGWGDP
jgi:predicted glycoside hydrolase/deacetylase ChbG (UPF0249 family)